MSGRRRKSGHEQRTSAPRGAVLILVLSCLAIAGLMVAATFRAVIYEHRLLRQEAWRRQAAWLAESGLERAVARLHQDASYAGETWDISPEQLRGPDKALLKIRVQPHPEAGAQGREIVSEAEYPAGNLAGARERRVIEWQTDREGSER